MGYYTDFCIETVAGDDVLETDKFNKIFKEIVGTEYEDWLNLKWYEWEEDMKTISKHFPKTVFLIQGDGEESEDFWKAECYNGKLEVSIAELIYPPLHNNFKEDLIKQHPEAML